MSARWDAEGQRLVFETPLTEMDVRRIVLDEMRRREMRAAREFHEHMLESAKRSEVENPAKPGSLLAKIQEMRREAAEQGLATALLADVSGDLLDGFPDRVDLGGESGGGEVVGVLDEAPVGAGVTADAADRLGDVGHAPEGRGSWWRVGIALLGGIALGGLIVLAGFATAAHAGSDSPTPYTVDADGLFWLLGVCTVILGGLLVAIRAVARRDLPRYKRGA